MDLPRSSFYYTPVPITEENLTLMRVLDEQYTATPFYGSRRMQVALQGAGHQVNRKHVQRLMRRMGLEAVGPKPRLSEAHPGHRVYPYLLRNVPIVRVDQVWSTDITYVRLRHGFVLRPILPDADRPGRSAPGHRPALAPRAVRSFL